MSLDDIDGCLWQTICLDMNSRYRTAIKNLASRPLIIADWYDVLDPMGSPVGVSDAGSPLAIFLSDTVAKDDWVAIPVLSDTLYVNPRAILRRTDVLGVRSGVTANGNGLLALDLSQQACETIASVTLDHPGKRLSLVVGRTLVAAQPYLAPLESRRLAFHVGTQHAAATLARAVAGHEDPCCSIRLLGLMSIPSESVCKGRGPRCYRVPVNRKRCFPPYPQNLHS
jgi:hypothetical protein